MNSVIRWLEGARDWLDERGKPAWITAMVLGFIFVWPVGLAILFYMIGRKKMKHGFGKFECRHRRGTNRKTGNTAFDAYREETLKRLEEERDSFVTFLDELRAAKDRAEFDQFMSNRRNGEVVPS